MKHIIFLLVSCIFLLSLSGCYVYTREPLPPPAVVIIPGGNPPPPPPAGEVGPVR